MKRLLYFLPVLIFAVVAGYFLWGLDPARDPRAVPSARVGTAVTPFELPPLDGSAIPGLSSADLADGQVTLVNFFASWCVPCRAEHPLLMQLAAGGTLRLVGINYKDAPADASKWLDELGNPYDRIGADRDGRAGIDWGVSGVPETFIVDRQGVIRHQHIGPVMPRDLERKILPLVEELGG
ncbi:MAG: DsbE family thiol:disulfide interchange protein [Kiloniellales bacterium]